MHTLLLTLFVGLDFVAFAWLIRTIRRRRKGKPATNFLDRNESAVKLSVSGTVLIVDSRYEVRAPFDLAQASTISVLTASGSNGVRHYVDLRGQRGRRIPVVATGFAEFERVLLALPGLDHAAYARAMKSNSAGRMTVLARELAINARLLPDVPESIPEAEFARGLMLVRGGRELPVAWDILYDDLAALGGVTIVPDEYETPQYRLGAVRVGGLILEDLRVNVPKYRSDVPVREWTTYAVLNHNGDENYKLLKRYFDATSTRLDASFANYQRDDQRKASWLSDGISPGIVYWYNTPTSPELRYVWLSFRNDRRYPAFYTDAYCEQVQPGQIESTVFPVADVTVERDFRKSRYVRETPAGLRRLIPDKDHWLVWTDKTAGKIGFASLSDALIVDRAEAESLVLQNVSPGKGGGYAVLSVLDRSGGKVAMGTANYKAFDALLDPLSTKLGLPAKVLQEFNDS